MKRLLLLATAVVAIPASAATLAHRWSFDSDASDRVGGANGTLMNGATVSGGALSLAGGSGATGAYLDLPAGSIAINTYSAGLTLELWHTQPMIDQGFSMTAAFGGTWDSNVGKDYLMISTTRGDNVSKGAIANTPDNDSPWNDEIGATGAELNDAIEHLYTLVVTATALSYYIDGVQAGTTQDLGTSTIANIATDFAYLGKGVYTGDGTVNGAIDEFRIWNGALTASEVAASFAAGPAVVVPEPATISLAVAGLGGLLMARRRRA